MTSKQTLAPSSGKKRGRPAVPPQLTKTEQSRYEQLSTRLGHIGTHWQVNPEEYAEWEKLADKKLAYLEYQSMQTKSADKSESTKDTD